MRIVYPMQKRKNNLTFLEGGGWQKKFFTYKMLIGEL